MSDRAQAALLDACRAAPDDDGPRLVWADAVGGERGELVVIQCDLARGDLSPAAAGARRRRERELLALHGRAWSGLAGLARRATFRRGFVDAAEIEVATFLARAAEIRRAAPLLAALGAVGLQAFEDRDDATYTGHDALPLLERLFASAAYRELRAIDIQEAELVIYPDRESAYPRGYGDEVAELIVRTRAHARWVAFGMRGSELGERGLGLLAGAGVLDALERLWLYEWTLPGAAIGRVLARMPRLRALALGPELDLETLAALPATVRELRLRQRTTDAVLAALVASPAAATLERLALGPGVLGDGTQLFARLPRLRALDLHDVAFGSWRAPATQSAALRRFVAAPLPALRELAGVPVPTPADAFALADALGAQLEHLDLRRARSVNALGAELRTRVAGEVLIGDGAPRVHLLRATAAPGEPWADHGTLDLR